MKAVALLVLIAAAHIAFLFGVYGSGLFGILRPLSYMLVFVVWLGASSALAGMAYFKVGSGLRWLSAPARGVLFALVATACSLYIGVFLAFNTFGT